MENKEKKDAIKLSCSITEDGKHMLIFEDNTEELISRTSFYNTTLTNEEKMEIGESMISKLFGISANRDVKRKESSWQTRSEAFNEAYKFQEKDKNSVVWLMTTILELTYDEAARRFDIFTELMSHPDFKDKEDAIIEKVYLNHNHLSYSELKDSELIGN